MTKKIKRINATRPTGRLTKTRIMVFGTFDLLHRGHEHFFRQARSLAKNPYLIVSVARDVNVKRIKGQRPMFNERQRLAAVKANPLVDEVVLGAIAKHIPHILKAGPNIIALGYDQTDYVKGLKADLAARGLHVTIHRLKPHQPHRYKSSLLKTRLAKKRSVV